MNYTKFTKIRAEIEDKQCTIIIPEYFAPTGFKTSTYQLLDLITMHLTENGAKSPSVKFTLDEYMQRRGLKDRKAAREQVKADLQVLRGISIQWKKKGGKKTEVYSSMNIADSGELKRNGIITFTFGGSFFNMLKSYPVMAYPAQLQKLNNKRNPNSYYLGRKISEHKNMNYGKANENIISVQTLLSVAPYIPSYEKVMETGRQLGQRIIKPFERDMDALQEMFSWEYCKKNGEKLTGQEIGNLNYILFESLNVLIHWHNYPDEWQKERLAAKEKQKRKRIKKAKAKAANANQTSGGRRRCQGKAKKQLN